MSDLRHVPCQCVCHFGGHCGGGCCSEAGKKWHSKSEACINMKVAVFSKDLRELLGEGIIKEVKIPDIGEVGEFDFEAYPSKIELNDGRVVNGRDFQWSPI